MYVVDPVQSSTGPVCAAVSVSSYELVHTDLEALFSWCLPFPLTFTFFLLGFPEL